MVNEWIPPSILKPRNHEVVFFWVNYPKRLALIGRFIEDDEGGRFEHFLDADFFSGPTYYKADSGWVDHWCRINDPLGEVDYDKEMRGR